MLLRVRPEVVLKLFDLTNESVEPELALEAVEQLDDVEVADLLDLYIQAIAQEGEQPSALIRSAVRRLRDRVPQVGVIDNKAGPTQ